MGATRAQRAERAAIRAKLKPLHDAGLNNRQIADELGISVVSAAAHIHHLGLEQRPAMPSRSISKPTKDPAPDPSTKPLAMAVAAGRKPLSTRERVALEVDISRAFAAVRDNPTDEEAVSRYRSLIATRDHDAAARAAHRVAA